MFIGCKLVDVYNGATSGRKSGYDKFLVRECLMSKIGELLAKDKTEIYRLLSEKQVALPSKVNDRILTEILFDQIRRDKDFANSVIKVMLKKDGTPNVKESEFRNMSDTLVEIANIGTNAKKIVLEYKNQWIYGDDEAKKLYADNSGNDVDKKLLKWSWKKTLLVIGGVSVIAYFGYRWYKNKKANASIENVEDVENIESIE